MSPQTVEILRKTAVVPSMPQVVTRFLEVIQDQDFDYQDVVKVLSVDAGTVSEILRLANSALFGVSRKVTSLKQALTLLGPKRTRSVVLGRFLVDAMGKEKGGTLDAAYFWRRSLVCAVIAGRLAQATNPRLRDEVFLCGLLANVGITILDRAFPQEYQGFAQSFAPYGPGLIAEEEVAAVGASHAEVSELVLSDWSLPETMCRAVAHSHDDAITGDDDGSQMARIINSSDRIAKLLCEIPDVTQSVQTCTRAMEFVGVAPVELVKMLGEIEGEVEELASVLRIDVVPSSVYGTIAKAIQEKLSAPTLAV